MWRKKMLCELCYTLHVCWPFAVKVWHLNKTKFWKFRIRLTIRYLFLSFLFFRLYFFSFLLFLSLRFFLCYFLISSSVSFFLSFLSVSFLMFLFLCHLMLWMRYGIWLYQFLTIALSRLHIIVLICSRHLKVLSFQCFFRWLLVSSEILVLVGLNWPGYSLTTTTWWAFYVYWFLNIFCIDVFLAYSHSTPLTEIIVWFHDKL